MGLRRRWPRRVTFPVVAVVLALGAPLGLLALRLALGRAGDLGVELDAQALTYTYLLTSTTVVFVVLGWLLGRKEDALQAKSLTDPLTGLWNRRHLHARLVDEVARAARYHTPVALLLVDVDGLKQINDGAGHVAGDRALQVVAAAIRGSVRTTDVAGRFGGDEFAVLAPQTTARDAVEVAARIQTALRVGGVDMPSVSIGVADLETADVDGAGPEALYQAADEALYDAKRHGRNRAEVAAKSGARTLARGTRTMAPMGG